MSVLGKILTLLRGSARELGESVVDANGTRIYEQEIVDAKNSVAKARQELTMVMAKEMQSARSIERLRAQIVHYENLALEALGKSENNLAEEVAAKVGELEAELVEQTKSHAEYAVNVSRLKELIKSADSKVREHERELAMAQTTESVYRATQTISHSIGASGSKLLSAKESLERIKQRHTDLSDRMAAADLLDQESGTKALEEKLAAAGIGSSANRTKQVMERLQAKVAEGGGSSTASE